MDVAFSLRSSPFVYVSDWDGVRKVSSVLCIPGQEETGVASQVWAAMRKGHASQMLWFRYLYLAFSRYLLVNTLRRYPEPLPQLSVKQLLCRISGGCPPSPSSPKGRPATVEEPRSPRRQPFIPRSAEA